MRKIRITCGLATTACALAISVAPAAAHQFTVTASPTPAITRGPGEGLQQLKLNPFTIKCLTAASTGKVLESPSPTLLDNVTYTKCTSYTLPVKFLTPVDYEYNAEGFASIVNTTMIEIKVSQINCVITIPQQRIPGEEEGGKSVSYTDELVPTTQLKKFPSGFRERLVLHNSFKEIAYKLSGGLCEGLEEKEHTGGTGSGVLRDEIIAGNLGWE